MGIYVFQINRRVRYYKINITGKSVIQGQRMTLRWGLGGCLGRHDEGVFSAASLGRADWTCSHREGGGPVSTNAEN